MTETGRWNIRKLGRLFPSKKAREQRMTLLDDAITRGGRFRIATQTNVFKEIFSPLCARIRREAENRLMGERDDQERLKLIGRMAAVDEIFGEIYQTIETGEHARIELEKLKGK